jgi:hypothetical protein
MTPTQRALIIVAVIALDLWLWVQIVRAVRWWLP